MFVCRIPYYETYCKGNFKQIYRKHEFESRSDSVQSQKLDEPLQLKKKNLRGESTCTST